MLIVNAKLYLDIEAGKNLKLKIKPFKFVIIFAMKCFYFNKLSKIKIGTKFSNILMTTLMKKKWIRRNKKESNLKKNKKSKEIKV